MRAGLTIEAAAPKLDISASKLSRIDNAHQGVDVHIVRSMLDLFRTHPEGGRADVADRERCPMPAPNSAGVTWRKSSFSNGNSGADGCVGVALLPGGEVAVRDTKDRTLPPHHHSAPRWREFLAAVRAGEFS